MEQSQVTDEEIRRVRNTVVGKDRVEIWSKMLYYLCTELLYLREAKRMALRAAPEHDTGAEAVARVSKDVSPSGRIQVDWLIPPSNFPIGTKLYTQPAHGEREPLKVSALLRARESGIAEGLERAAQECFDAIIAWDMPEPVPTHLAKSVREQMAAAIRALAPTKQPDAEGGQFVVVPREPTPEMIDAAWHLSAPESAAYSAAPAFISAMTKTWLAMLAALPAVPEKKK